MLQIESCPSRLITNEEKSSTLCANSEKCFTHKTEIIFDFSNKKKEPKKEICFCYGGKLDECRSKYCKNMRKQAIV